MHHLKRSLLMGARWYHISRRNGAAVREEIATAERAARAIQERLGRLDEAFLFERSIDIETDDCHADKLREELTLARIDRHSGQLEELDAEGILAFAEPNGIAFDGNRFVRTGVTAPVFSYLREIKTENEGLVDLERFELSTSSMPWKRAPNCATGPLFLSG
jgi:hypothetical protein